MSESSSDAWLLSRWAEGDKEAGNELATRHFHAIYCFFRRRVPTVAEDLTQQTFLGCIEGRERLSEMSSFRAYLFGIARNRMLMYLRKERGADPSATPPGPSILSPSQVVDEVREQKLVVRALRSLPLELQIVCEMFYWEGLRAREIGEVLEVSTSTITSRLARARQLLRERVEELGEDARLVTSTIEDLEGWARSLARVYD